MVNVSRILSPCTTNTSSRTSAACVNWFLRSTTLFIRSSRERIDRIKDEMGMTLPIRYIMDRESRQPIVVPTSQMRSFMAVAGSYDQQLVYLEPSAVAFRKGQRVRVTGGIFAGVEGEFIRVKNDRRVMVSIQCVMAVATTYIHPSLIEPLDL